METKELKIEIPKGYEIDKENSTLECVIFKPIKKDITYKDVCNKLFERNASYSINLYGKIGNFSLASHRFDVNNASNKKQLERVLALNQLLNIAEYYNKLHENGINSVIKYDNIKQTYVVTKAFAMYTCGIRAIFNRTDDAQAVIDNPNFREILDEIFKN